MPRLIAAALVSVVVGSVRFAQHLNRPMTLDDYLAFRCAPGDAAIGPGGFGHAILSAAHCWGCYAMVVGVGLLVFAAWRHNRIPRDVRTWPV